MLVTIHDVETSGGPEDCPGLYGVIGTTPENVRKSVKHLNAKRGMIQGVVMKRVVLRCTPILHFKIDESIERGVRVLNILDEIGEIELSDLPEGESPLK